MRENEVMEVGQVQRQKILEMAECYLWRGEVKRVHFYLVLSVLEALGWLDETTVAHIHDDLDDLYPEPGKKQEVAGETTLVQVDHSRCSSTRKREQQPELPLP